MIITHNIRIGSIISGAWKVSIFNLFVCVASWGVNEAVIKNYFEFPIIIPTLLGTALAFFVGFHNNQAYDRWWEARIIWGALVNDSRTWARQCIQYIPLPVTDGIVRQLVLRHLAFVNALRESLRLIEPNSYKNYLTDAEKEYVQQFSNKHNAILDLQSSEINRLYKTGVIDGFTFMQLNETITAHCDHMGKSERIKNTIFPTTYNYYSKLFIWFLIASVTIVLSNTIGLWAILFGFFIGYIFLTIHQIGDALLDPFIYIPTGIPLDQITRTIEINLLEMLHDTHVPEPIKSIKNEYVM
jgi:ion channel-forming bestrophin family protein